MGRNTLDLDDSLQMWMDTLVENGYYKTKSEVVRECMRRMRPVIDRELGRVWKWLKLGISDNFKEWALNNIIISHKTGKWYPAWENLQTSTESTDNMKLRVIAQNDIQAVEYLREMYGIKGTIKCELVDAVRRNHNHTWNITIRQDLGEVWNVFSVEFEDTLTMMLPREYCIKNKQTEYLVA